MKQLIDRINAQLERLKRQYPEASVRHEADFSLNKGAGEADFAELEKELGYALPEDFKELYRIADGEAGQEVVLAGEEWLSVARKASFNPEPSFNLRKPSGSASVSASLSILA